MNLRPLMTIGLVLMVVGGVLALDYYVNPSRHTKIIRYGDFIAILRTGQGTSLLSNCTSSTGDIPVSGLFWDLKVYNVTYNFSVLYDYKSILCAHFLAVITYPGGDLFVTPWIYSSDLDPKVARQGLKYPHRIEINYVNVTLRVFANDTILDIPYVYWRHKFVTEKNSSEAAGFYLLLETSLDYLPDESVFVFYLLSGKLRLAFNSDGWWGFYMFASFNVSFWQEYGPSGTYFAQNFTLGRWMFYRHAENITVNVFANHSNYLLLPTYMPFHEQPVVELAVFALGLCVDVVCLTIYIGTRYRKQ